MTDPEADPEPFHVQYVERTSVLIRICAQEIETCLERLLKVAETLETITQLNSETAVMRPNPRREERDR